MLNPEFTTAYVWCACGWITIEANDKAIKDANEALKREPGNIDALVYRGIARLKKGQHDKAMADLTEAIRLDPRRVDAFYARGIAWYHQKKYDKAIADWDHALELNLELAQHSRRAVLLAVECPDKNYRDAKKAIELATRACELTGWNDAETLGILSSAYYEAGDLDAAIKWRTKANELTPGIRNKLLGKTMVFIMNKLKDSGGESP